MKMHYDIIPAFFPTLQIDYNKFWISLNWKHETVKERFFDTKQLIVFHNDIHKLQLPLSMLRKSYPLHRLVPISYGY